MNIIIMSGISGSGKNVYILNQLAYYGNVVVCSDDDYFETLNGYKFDSSKVADASSACLRRYIQTMLDDVEHGPANMSVVVNNCNLTVADIAPYYAIARAYGHKVELITIDCAPHIAAARSLHCKDLSRVKEMHDLLMARKLPSNWKLSTTSSVSVL
jgi:predicted kinase